MSTADNLQEAFAGESQANRKYLAFAKQAEADSKPQVAKLFRAAAEAETVHAHAHLRAMGAVATTQDNVKAAIEGEGHEFNVMYPDFIEEAKKENNQAALKSFEFAIAVEKIHYDLYSKAAEALNSGEDLEPTKIFVCPVCGNTVLEAAPVKCPICSVPGTKFSEIN